MKLFRRSILLLELLIALVIMGAVLEMLFLGYRQAIKVKGKLQIEKENVLGVQRLLLRLGLLFRSVKSFEEVAPYRFFLKYQAGMDHDHDFRGALEGCLYLDRKRLVLVSWSEEGKMRTEVLYENVDTISCAFFDPKSGAFASVFPATNPPMMKITLNSTLELPLFL